jgi:hypothetical protein
MRKLSVIGVCVVLALFAFTFTACSEGPMGPVGATGSDAQPTDPEVPVDGYDPRV